MVQRSRAAIPATPDLSLVTSHQVRAGVAIVHPLNPCPDPRPVTPRPRCVPRVLAPSRIGDSIPLPMGSYTGGIDRFLGS